MIYALHPNKYIYIYIYMGIQCTKMIYRRFGLSTFWSVDVLVCRRLGLSTFGFVDVLVCRRFGLSTFWFVDFWFVDVSVCRRFGLSTSWLSTFQFVDVLTSYLSTGSRVTWELYQTMRENVVHVKSSIIGWKRFGVGYEIENGTMLYLSAWCFIWNNDI